MEWKGPIEWTMEFPGGLYVLYHVLYHVSSLPTSANVCFSASFARSQKSACCHSQKRSKVGESRCSAEVGNGFLQCDT